MDPKKTVVQLDDQAMKKIVGGAAQQANYHAIFGPCLPPRSKGAQHANAKAPLNCFIVIL